MAELCKTCGEPMRWMNFNGGTHWFCKKCNRLVPAPYIAPHEMEPPDARRARMRSGGY